MDILNPKTLRQQADMALRRGRDPKKLTLTFAGISLGLSVVLYLINLWLDEQISGTGGLGNLGDRAILATAQQALPVLAGFVTMCLDLGFLAGLMRISRGQYADHTDLKVGFRKFWPLVRLSLIQAMLYFAIGFLAIQLGSTLFLLTPWADPVVEVLYPLTTSGSAVLDEALLMELSALMMPAFCVMAVVFLLILLPFLFKMRMAYFCLLDDPRGRAMAAIRESSRMMRRRFGQMLKIDLSLWLYYVGMALSMLVLYLDLILDVLGIPFPMDAQLFSLVIYIGSAAVQFAVFVFLRPSAEITYLRVYDALREKPKDSGVVLGNIFDM